MQIAQGHVANGFEEVRDEFERNFSHRGEVGACVAAFWRGRNVVDLWGGHRTRDRREPWTEDTLVGVMSATKGMSALAVAVANSRGMIDYDAPVARYWPAFAQNGKERITVRQLLAHEAGLVLLDEDLPMARLQDLDHIAEVLARQKPAWEPGTKHGYHTMSLGLYEQELIRRTDAKGRTLGQFFREEIAAPLGIEFYIGLPHDFPAERIATIETLSPWRAILGLRKTPLPMLIRAITSGGVLMKSFLISDLNWNARQLQEAELPAGSGVGNAKALARAYSALAEGGRELGISEATMAELTALPDMSHPIDEVLGVESAFTLGFIRPSPANRLGSSSRAFGAPGAGGSFAFADPDARLGFAYVMNRLDFYLSDDPREKSLRDAVYRAIEQQQSRL